MLKFRTFVIGLFSLCGAVLSVVTTPNVLDFMFDSIKASSYVQRSNSPSAFEIEQFVFQKVIYNEETLANDDISMLGAKKTNLPKIAQERKLTLEVVRLSKNALERPDLKPLKTLGVPKKYVLIKDDPSPGLFSIYEFVSKDRTGRQSAIDESPQGYAGSRQPLILFALAILGAVLGGVIGSLMINLFNKLRVVWNQLETGDKVNIFLGGIIGIIGSLPFLIALSNLGPVVASLLTFGLTVGFSALSVYALNSVEEVLPWKKGEYRGRKSGIKVLDTNVLIDGRIYDLIRTGFLEGEIYVPKFVLLELQHIADSADALRRQRGRRGLEILKHLQTDHPIEVGTHDRFAPDEKEEVDSRLVKLAMALGADLVSNDYNLNKVASIQNVRVLNINDLALSLRPTILPGEVLEVQIIREGSQQGQGVGYLDDGTMIVVENGRSQLGSLTEVMVTQVIQTERGKMIFGTYGSSDSKRFLDTKH